MINKGGTVNAVAHSRTFTIKQPVSSQFISEWEQLLGRCFQSEGKPGGVK